MFSFYLQPSVTQNNEMKRGISHNYNKQTAKRDGGNSFIIIIIMIKSNKKLYNYISPHFPIIICSYMMKTGFISENEDLLIHLKTVSEVTSFCAHIGLPYHDCDTIKRKIQII